MMLGNIIHNTSPEKHALTPLIPTRSNAKYRVQTKTKIDVQKTITPFLAQFYNSFLRPS
jgi:hypothetical protein